MPIRSPCAFCGAPAVDERTDSLDSTEGPILVTRWRCTADVSHWWTGTTDAAAGWDELAA